jgi:hypothetical protein
MDLSSFSSQELTALVRALDFVRFESREPGAAALAGVPALGRLQALAAETLWAKVDTSTTAYFRTHGFPDVAQEPARMAAIEFHISQADNWNELAETTKQAHIQELVFPFPATPQTLQQLLLFGNRFHGPKG